MFARGLAKYQRSCITGTGTSFFRRGHSTCSLARERTGNAAALLTNRCLPLNIPSVGCVQVRAYSSDGNNVSISKKIEKMVNNKKVVVFMKGVPEQPMCGFSNAVVQVLRIHGVDDYDSHNVLEDEELRQGIKEYSSWPTIPQVYFNGEFIGGCDILLQMHQNGELIEELEKVGVKSAVEK